MGVLKSILASAFVQRIIISLAIEAIETHVRPFAENTDTQFDDDVLDSVIRTLNGSKAEL